MSFKAGEGKTQPWVAGNEASNGKAEKRNARDPFFKMYPTQARR